MNALRIGSLCSGYGGLDMAVQAVLGGEIAWHADPDPDAATVLAHHHPGVPNLGDIKLADWANVPPVDIVCGGYPCQPFSAAGKRKGVEDERHLWPYIVPALRVLRPQIAIFENVANHLGLGFDVVLADLAALGFDVEWRLVRASDVGAPHRRTRLIFIAIAQDADRPARGEWRIAAPRQASGRGPRPDAGRRGGTPAPDTEGTRREGPRPESARRRPERSGGAPADAQGDRWDEGRPEPARQLGRPDAALGGEPTLADTDRDAVRQQPVAESGRDGATLAGLPGIGWGPYGPAIRRWEHATGRPAPRPTEPGRTGERLSPRFVEWMMGLPAGHVTAVPGLSRNAQLRLLGNGVVPQQGAAAFAHLLERRAAA